jgi:acetyl esterase/lipase
MNTGNLVTTNKVEIITDIIYTIPNGSPQILDLYLPIGIERPLPVIIWLHGGGWRFGDRKLAPNLSYYFAVRGFAMVSIDYRLSGEAVWPAQIHDVKTAIRWVRSVGKEYGLDVNNIGLWGSSSGGHLASLAGTTGSGTLEGAGEYLEESSDVQAVAVGYGPTDFLQIEDHKALLSETVSTDPESVRIPEGISMRSSEANSFESLLMGAVITSCPERVREANPITYVKSGTPPFLLMHGTSDTAVPTHQSEILYNALAKKRNDVTLILIEGLGHGFLNQNDFDKGEPRKKAVFHAQGGENKKILNCPPFSFKTIEEFFYKHLCK